MIMLQFMLTMQKVHSYITPKSECSDIPREVNLDIRAIHGTTDINLNMPFVFAFVQCEWPLKYSVDNEDSQRQDEQPLCLDSQICHPNK